MNDGAVLWTVGLILLGAYVVQLATREPRQTRVPLLTYWLLFIVLPLVGFGAVLGFSALAFGFGFLVLLALVMVGERGLRWWIRLFGTP